MDYFIADTHFGHANVIRFCDRPFKDVNEMDSVMMANWNARVDDCDHIYIIGDMFFRCDDPEKILATLKEASSDWQS